MSDLEITNDPEVERQGANAAAQYAEAFWSRLTEAARRDGRERDCTWEDGEDGDECEDDWNPDNAELYSPGTGHPLNPETDLLTSKLTLTHSSTLDTLLHKKFRSNLPLFPLSHVGSLSPTSPLHTPLWSSLLTALDGTVPDFSFMTVLRSRHLDVFTATETEGCEGTVVVPRGQFLMVEVGRCREGMYGRRFRRRLTVGSLTDYRVTILTSLHDAVTLKATVERLAAEHPLPRYSDLKKTLIGRALKKAFLAGCGEAGSLMERWRAGVSLGRVARGVGRGAEAARYAVGVMGKEGSGVTQARETEGAYGTAESIDVSGLSPSSSAALFSKTGVIYSSTAVIPSNDLAVLRTMADEGLNDLVTNELTPRGLTLEDEFDYKEVRHRPGNRLDTRHKITPDTVKNNDVIKRTVDAIFGETDAGKHKLMYAGVVHAFAGGGGPQVWHRDGPSLFDHGR